MAYARAEVKMRAKVWAEVAKLLTDRDRLEKNVVDQTLRVSPETVTHSICQ